LVTYIVGVSNAGLLADALGDGKKNRGGKPVRYYSQDKPFVSMSSPNVVYCERFGSRPTHSPSERFIALAQKRADLLNETHAQEP
jgi:hypothetical protein